ncbi:hypothetical protein QJS66_22205 [Kocuria rhizophila]|nr:hypothetical protein QJS66_22205 [Kocuria rhizophila]
MTVNLAAALAAMGRTVGIVDADVHGFDSGRWGSRSSHPRGRHEPCLPGGGGSWRGVDDASGGSAGRDEPPLPRGGQGDPDRHVRGSLPAAAAWRGPMLHRAVEQFLTDVHFGPGPPAPGPAAGHRTSPSRWASCCPAPVWWWSPPAHAAVSVAQRSATWQSRRSRRSRAWRRTCPPMVTPDGSTLEVFGAGGGETIAASSSPNGWATTSRCSAACPLDVTVREASDRGVPAVWAHPESPAAAQRRADRPGAGPAGPRLLPGSPWASRPGG